MEAAPGPTEFRTVRLGPEIDDVRRGERVEVELQRGESRRGLVRAVQHALGTRAVEILFDDGTRAVLCRRQGEFWGAASGPDGKQIDLEGEPGSPGVMRALPPRMLPGIECMEPDRSVMRLQFKEHAIPEPSGPPSARPIRIGFLLPHDAPHDAVERVRRSATVACASATAALQEVHENMALEPCAVEVAPFVDHRWMWAASPRGFHDWAVANLDRPAAGPVDRFRTANHADLICFVLDGDGGHNGVAPVPALDKGSGSFFDLRSGTSWCWMAVTQSALNSLEANVVAHELAHVFGCAHQFAHFDGARIHCAARASEHVIDGVMTTTVEGMARNTSINNTTTSVRRTSSYSKDSGPDAPIHPTDCGMSADTASVLRAYYDRVVGFQPEPPADE